MEKKLYKSSADKKIDGVCGGIAAYFKVDSTIIRVAWVLVSVFAAVPGIVAYAACCILLPKEPENVIEEAAVTEGE